MHQNHAGALDRVRTLSKFSRVCGPLLPLLSPLHGPMNDVQCEVARQCRPALLLLFQTLLYLWAAPCSVESSSIWFQALCCSFSVASLSLSSSHGGGTSVMLVFDIQTPLTVGARRSKSHRRHPWPFVIGPRSVPRHRLPFKAGLCPAVIKVLFSASLNPRSVKKKKRLLLFRLLLSLHLVRSRIPRRWCSIGFDVQTRAT